MRITNIITVVLMTIIVAALFAFLFYPYSELSSMQEKLDHAVHCLYAITACTIGLAATAFIAARN